MGRNAVDLREKRGRDWDERFLVHFLGRRTMTMLAMTNIANATAEVPMVTAGLSVAVFVAMRFPSSFGCASVGIAEELSVVFVLLSLCWISTGLSLVVGAGSSCEAGAINFWPSSVAAELSAAWARLSSGAANAMETMEAQKRAKSKVDASSFFAFPFVNISLSHSCLKGI
jgi:hypothetical protein